MQGDLIKLFYTTSSSLRASSPFYPSTSPRRVLVLLGLLGLPPRRRLSPSSLACWHVTIKRFGGDTSPEVGLGRFDEGSALTPFSALTSFSALAPLPLLDTLLGWPA